HRLLDRLLLMPWNVKAKLKLLAVLMPWLDPLQLLEKREGIITEMSGCLDMQYLASAAGKLYKAFIRQLSYDAWKGRVMEQFIQALISPSRLTRYNMRQYWLPFTIAQYPESRWILIRKLSSEISYLPGLIAVGQAMKSSIQFLQLVEVKHLQRALKSSNDEMRADVFSLLSVSPPAGLTAIPIHLLESYLPFNLTIDCPSFRHQLLSAMHSWMDGLSHYLKYNRYLYQQVVKTVDPVVKHVKFLWTLCHTSMVRGSNYQRKETTLKLSIQFVKLLSEVFQKEDLREALHSYICQEENCPEQGGCLGMALFKQKVINSALLDSSSEIQDLAYKLLAMPVSTEFQQYWGTPLPYLLENAELWQSYITSPKASEAEAGALIYTLIVTLTSDWNYVQHKIIDLLDICVCGVEKDSNLMASGPHVYGYLVAIQRILSRTGYLNSLGSQELAALGLRLTDISTRAMNVILKVMMSKCSNKDVSPSFEQVEEGIEQLVIDAQANKRIGNDVQGATERVTAWCWLTLKEVCCLCGTLSSCSLSAKDLLLPATVQSMREVFYSTLTKCRHRGVIEGSSAGLSQFCQAMLESRSTEYNCLPSDIINQVLNTTVREDKVVSKCSVTRRSGGFPIIVQSVLAAESRCKQSSLLYLVIDELLRSCDTLAQVQQDERADLPQVHSLNMLKALVVDAGLTGGVRSYLARITMLCISSFSSPIWSLRNAATQLFASCSERLIGQKRQSNGEKVSTSSVEFFSQYPSLYDFMLERLRKSDPCGRNAEIFPILSLISLLSPSTLIPGHTR
ncbi:tRNA (32-2'-O)-methyltransferase regulator THADA-like, partial [Watersipora subatra]|uniref:tRNA (32-2'-O)-methyltransferase regulator THADA-like n=1 Tax=Watersipora subatra TaxID=2589382 RepID=UPI00355B5478